jgi:hypothetical protein
MKCGRVGKQARNCKLARNQQTEKSTEDVYLGVSTPLMCNLCEQMLVRRLPKAHTNTPSCSSAHHVGNELHERAGLEALDQQFSNPNARNVEQT